MATTADIRNGLIIEHKNDLYRVVDFQHVKPGKGGAFVRTKLKNLKTGRVIDETWNSGESITPVRLRHVEILYLYNGGGEYHFMDNESYEQFSMTDDQLRDYLPYMTENMTLQVLVRDDGTHVDLVFPDSVELTVTMAPGAARGDTSGPVTKPVTVETGYELQVPPFIKEGDRIRIDTSTGKYLERV